MASPPSNATPPDAPLGTARVSEDDLHALADGQLSGAAREALERRVASDPRAQQALRAWQHQRDALRGLHTALLSAPVPPAMVAAVDALEGRQARVRDGWRLGGMAAAVVLAFGLGWVAHGRLGAAPAARPQLAAADFARQAAVAHLVYAPEQRHPVEVGAAQQEHLVQWLSKRLGRTLKVPDLQGEGFALVGGRLLPGTDGARAQFMFQDAAGVRITLYLGGVTAGRPGTQAPPAVRETAFSFSSDGPVPGFYWVDQGFGYALAGPLPRERLLALAQRVYELLQS